MKTPFEISMFCREGNINFEVTYNNIILSIGDKFLHLSRDEVKSLSKLAEHVWLESRDVLKLGEDQCAT